MDALGALVGVVVPVGEVSELLELSEQVVERLFAHAGLNRELGGALVLGAGPGQQVEVGGNEIGVAALVQAREHPVAHRLVQDSQERTDQFHRRIGALLNGFSKVA